MPRLTPVLVPFAALLVACPQAQPTAGATPQAAEVDPRVVADSSDLYAGKPPLTQFEAPPPPASPGTGRPDETNGKCRLYAPELQNPTCCEHTLGFDVAAAQRACGMPVYLGESFHGTCGFFFLREAGTVPQWLRLSTIRGDTAKQAADEHVLLMRRTSSDLAAEPLPGVPGAFWVKQDEYRWAFLPGWKRVRLLAWKDTSCSDEGIAALARSIIDAPEQVAGKRRDGLLPAAAPPPAPAPATRP